MKNKNSYIEDALPEFLKEYLPQIKKTKKLIENNDSHINDPVYIHLIKSAVVLHELLETLQSEYFREKIGKHSKIELFTLAALFHDVGKITTQREIEGITSSPGHEESSAEIAKIVLINKNFDYEEIIYVTNIISKHSTANKILNLPEDITEDHFKKLAKDEKMLYPELIIFGLVDNFAGNMDMINPLRFCRRVALLYAKITEIFG